MIKSYQVVQTQVVLVKSRSLSTVIRALERGMACTLSFIYQIVASQRICFRVFPGTELNLASLQFPGSSFLAFLKTGMRFISSHQEPPLIAMTFES